MLQQTFMSPLSSVGLRTIIYRHLCLEDTQLSLGHVPHKYMALVDKILLQQMVSYKTHHNNQFKAK